jgi:hypothetical protein
MTAVADLGYADMEERRTKLRQARAINRVMAKGNFGDAKSCSVSATIGIDWSVLEARTASPVRLNGAAISGRAQAPFKT